MKELTVQELKSKMDRNDDFQLIDVREFSEHEYCSIQGAELIPMGEILARMGEIDKEKEVIIHCKSGGRSGAIVNALMARGFSNVANLKGGILAWSQEIDPTIPTY
jgi:adenylyltransferase/sulfurtransferase